MGLISRVSSRTYRNIMIRLSRIKLVSPLKSLKSYKLNNVSSYQIIGHILNINRTENEFTSLPLEIKMKIAEEIISDNFGPFKNIKTVVEPDGRQITDEDEYS